MPNAVKKDPGGGGVPRSSPFSASGGAMSKLRQSGARLLHRTAQRLTLREEGGGVAEAGEGVGATGGGRTDGPSPSPRQDRTSPSSSTPPNKATAPHSKLNHASSSSSSTSSKSDRSATPGPSSRQDRPSPTGPSAARTPPSKKATTPQPEPRPSTAQKRRSASTDGMSGTGSTSRPRVSPARPRGGKVCFAPRVQLLGPSGSEERQERDAEELAEEQEQEQERQAESMRRLEQENESLRLAIENYRELEQRRAAGGSGGGAARTGQEARGQEDAEDGEEDEVEKAVEVSPSGVFLKFDEEIGRGSFKAVYKGLDTTTGVFVAWCELQLSGNRLSKKERDRFREEAGLMKGLTHPNIVRFYDFWEVEKPKRSCIVLVTELMTSGTLRTYLKNFGQKRVSLKIIKQWCRQILRGLQFLHSRNPPIIHRDLKCDNIFISGTTGQVKVGDLGLATLKNRSFAKSVIGTPEFMAPEVYEEHYDEAVDVYAFGMCMLEMVTSEYPYSECTGPAQIYKKVIMGIKPSSFDKIDDPQTRELIEWCTRLNSKERPTVKQLLNHEFFAEDCGMRLDVSNREEAVGSSSSVIHLQLRVLDAKKRRDTHKENEAIQFNYALNKDNPEETAKQMVMSGLLAEENCRPLAKMIANVIQSLVRAREERRSREQAGAQTAQPAAAPGVTSAGGTPGGAPGSAAPGSVSGGTPGGAAPQVAHGVAPGVAPGAASGIPPAAATVPPAAGAHVSGPSTAALPPTASSTSAATPGPTPVPLQASASLPAVSTAAAAAAPAAPAPAPAPAPVIATSTQTTQLPAEAEGRAAEMPPPPAPAVVGAEGGGTPGQQLPAEIHSDSATGAESDSALSEKKEKKSRARRRKTCERLPRLTVLEVKSSDNGPVVSCLLETNQSRAITFKFDLHEADVAAISYKMTEAHQLLPRDDAQYFEEQLRAVIRVQRELRAAAGAGQTPAVADGEATPAQPSEEPPTSAPGAGSPPQRPCDLSAPGQVADRSVPVLVRAPHGLQIVTLTPQQAAVLLRQAAVAAAPAPAPAPATGQAAGAGAAAEMATQPGLVASGVSGVVPVARGTVTGVPTAGLGSGSVGAAVPVKSAAVTGSPPVGVTPGGTVQGVPPTVVGVPGQSPALCGGAAARPASLVPAGGGGGQVYYATPSPVLAAPLPVLGSASPSAAASAATTAHQTSVNPPVTHPSTIAVASSSTTASSAASPAVSPPVTAASSAVPSAASSVASSAASSSAASTASLATSSAKLAAPPQSALASSAGVGTPGAGTTPLQAGAVRRSRFIVSSVVEGRASPVPSPSLQSPASELALSLLSAAGAATTSTSPSPQLAVLSPDPLTSPAGPPPLPDPPPVAGGASPAVSGPGSAVHTAAAAAVTSAGSSVAAVAAPAGGAVAVAAPGVAERGAPAAVVESLDGLKAVEGQTRPPTLAVSPESRQEPRPAPAPAAGTPAQRHVRFAVTPTVLNPGHSSAGVTPTSASAIFTPQPLLTDLTPQHQPLITPSATSTPLPSTSQPSTSPAPTPSTLSPPSAQPPLSSPVTASPAALSPTAAADTSTSVSETQRVNGVSMRAVNGAPVAGAEERTGGGAGTQEQPTSPLDSSMGNLAQLAKQLTRLTSQPPEAPGSGAQTPAEAAPSGRRGTVAGGGNQTQRPGPDSASSSAPPPQQPPPQPATPTPAAVAPSPADLSRPTSATDTGERRKPLPLLLSDLAKELSKLHVKPSPAGAPPTGPGGGPGAGSAGTVSASAVSSSAASPSAASASTASASTVSAAVQTQTPSEPTPGAPRDDPAKPSPSSLPPATDRPDGARSRFQPPADSQTAAAAASRADGQAAAVNGASNASAESAPRPVRKGRFAISKAPTAAGPPPSTPTSTSTSTSTGGPTAAQTASVEESALYRELVVRQQAAMADLLRQQGVERDNLRRQLRQQQEQQQQEQKKQPPCTENGTV